MIRQLVNWLRRGRLESDLDRELAYHLDRRAGDLIGSGLTESEARRQAAFEIGGPTQVREEVRDVWLTRWLRDFVYDLRYSARGFLRTPSFTATAVLSLALGIGATTAIYSLLDQVVLRALPVRQPDRLVLVDWKGDAVSSAFGSYNLLSYPLCRELQKQERFFEGVLCRAATTVILSTGGEHKPAGVEIVSGSYFPVLGVGAALGRVFTNEDDTKPGANPVVVLSHDFWRTQLGGAEDVIGRKVLVNHHPMTVVGVAALSFRGVDVGEAPALWLPASMVGQAIPPFTRLLTRERWMQVLGRLAPEMTLAQAQTGLQPWFKSVLDADARGPDFPRITPERRQRYFASTLELTPAPQGHSTLRRRLSQPLWVLLAATAVLLCLACLNVAGLVLARGSARGREIGTRLALGASGSRIGRQLLAESFLLALAGGSLGVALAPLALRALIALLPAEVSAHALQSTLDARVLLVAVLVSVVAGVASGVAPALHSGRRSLISSLRERGGAPMGGVRLRKFIVTAQIAFSLILLIGAALFVRTLTTLLSKGPGFDTASLVSFRVDPVRSGYSPEESGRLIRRIHEEIRASSLVESSAIARFQLLTGGSWNNPMTIQTNRRIVTDRLVNMNAVTPGFFATLGARILTGRDFDERDVRSARDGSRQTAVVNEAFVKRYFEGGDPIGARIVTGAGPDVTPNIEIVGVVSDFNYRGLRDQSEQAFFPSGDGGVDFGGNFYLRVRGAPEGVFQSIRAIVRQADPSLPVTNLRTVDEQVRRSLNTERILASLSAAFGVLALLLSVVGLYGVMSFVVTQRTREIGIRIALGASRRAALSLILRDAGLMVLAGAAIALPSTALLGRLLESQLFGVTATDPGAVAAATLLLSAACLAAALIPALRAASLRPIEALRLE